jgi:hypothetical protein
MSQMDEGDIVLLPSSQAVNVTIPQSAMLPVGSTVSVQTKSDKTFVLTIELPSSEDASTLIYPMSHATNSPSATG